MRISKVWTGFFHGIHGIFYVFFYTIAMLKFFSNYSSRSNLRVFYYFLELLWKILCIKRFYFLNYFIFFVIVFRIIRNMKETSSLINFFLLKYLECKFQDVDRISIEQQLQSSNINFKHESLNILSSQTTKCIKQFLELIYILFYFLRVVFKITKNSFGFCFIHLSLHQRNIVNFFFSNILNANFKMWTEFLWSNSCPKTTIFKLQTWIFKYIIFSNH